MLYVIYPIHKFREVDFSVESDNFIDPNEICIDSDDCPNANYGTKYEVCINTDRISINNGYVKSKAHYISLIIALYRVGICTNLLRKYFGYKEYYILPENLKEYYDKIFPLSNNPNSHSFKINLYGFLFKLNRLSHDYDHICKTIKYYTEIKDMIEKDLVNCIKANPAYRYELLNNIILPKGIKFRKELLYYAN